MEVPSAHHPTTEQTHQSGGGSSSQANRRRLILWLTLVILAVTCCSTLIPVIYAASLKHQDQQSVIAYQRLLPKQFEKSEDSSFMERSLRNLEVTLEERLAPSQKATHDDSVSSRREAAEFEPETHRPPSSNHKRHHLVRESSSSETTTTTTTERPHRSIVVPRIQKKPRKTRPNNKSVNALPIALSERMLRKNVTLTPECYKGRVVIGKKKEGIHARMNATASSALLTMISLKTDSKNRTIIAIQSAENQHYVCFNHNGKIISKKLKNRIPPNCQFVERVRMAHVKYTSVNFPKRSFGFDSEGRPYSYCTKGKCGSHHVRRHKKCMKFLSVEKKSHDTTVSKLDLTELVNTVHRNHPNLRA